MTEVLEVKQEPTSFWRSPAAGRLIEAVGSLIPALTDALIPKQGDQLTQLQIELTKLQVAKEAERLNPPAIRVEPSIFRTADRMDWLFLGPRGKGKTAMCCYVGQQMAEVQELPLYAVGWHAEEANQVGAFTCTPKEAKKLRDAVLMFDEASLRIRPGRRDGDLFEMLALARHRNLSCLWTAQTSSSVHRDVLRMGASYCFVGFDPIARLLDREELLEVQTMAEIVSQRNPDTQEPGGAVLLVEGQFAVVSGVPLPEGWTEQISKLWR